MTATRRAVLAGLLASAGSGALGRAPDASPRPPMRHGAPPPAAARPLEALLGEARLGGQVTFAVADVATGMRLESRNEALMMPPASTAKTLTADYGLETLGAGYRFRTRVVATGPVRGGTLEGDLVLLGGGDPTLDTDGLAVLARDLRAAGVRAVRGRYLYDDRALPAIRAIDPGQPPHVGYNPAVGGLNLNYNRVYFEWQQAGGSYRVAMDARSETLKPAVSLARMRVVDRSLPVYTYSDDGGVDSWTVARAALGKRGSRWLPVRRPGAYAAEVFGVLARGQGIALPPPEPATGRTEGTVLAERPSAPLGEVLKDMLAWSTNLTAEAVGLTATAARGRRVATLEASAAEMNGWAGSRLGAAGVDFVDHSGLGPASRVSAAEMVTGLIATGGDGPLVALMKDFPLRDQGVPQPVPVKAKTGTLNFVSALVGFVRPPGGRELAFAIYAADLERRRGLSDDEAERPAGGKEWTGRARALQRGLIERWATLYAA